METGRQLWVDDISFHVSLLRAIRGDALGEGTQLSSIIRDDGLRPTEGDKFDKFLVTDLVIISMSSQLYQGVSDACCYNC